MVNMIKTLTYHYILHAVAVASVRINVMLFPVGGMPVIAAERDNGGNNQGGPVPGDAAAKPKLHAFKTGNKGNHAGKPHRFS